MSEQFNPNFDFDVPSFNKFPQISTELKMIKTQNNLMLNSMSFFQASKENDYVNDILQVDSLAQKLPQNKQQQQKQKQQEEVENKQSTSQKKKKLGCTCKKTYCLKMYCECFSSNRPCNGDCQCINCRNTTQHQSQIINAKVSIRQKGVVGLHSCSLSQKRCNCKKSNCQKKYCECFNSGVKCSQACKCNNCYNKTQQRQKQEQPEQQKQPQQNQVQQDIQNLLQQNNNQQQAYQNQKNNFASFYN